MTSIADYYPEFTKQTHLVLMTSSFENYHTKCFFFFQQLLTNILLQMSNFKPLSITFVLLFHYTQYEYINDTGNYTKDLNWYIPTVTIWGYLILLWFVNCLPIPISNVERYSVISKFNSKYTLTPKTLKFSSKPQSKETNLKYSNICTRRKLQTLIYVQKYSDI